jgi:hypothetical protein
MHYGNRRHPDYRMPENPDPAGLHADLAAASGSDPPAPLALGVGAHRLIPALAAILRRLRRDSRHSAVRDGQQAAWLRGVSAECARLLEA